MADKEGRPVLGRMDPAGTGPRQGRQDMAPTGLDQKRAEFMARAEAAFDRMFEADGQNGLVTFTQREERACQVTDELARWLLAEHLTLDPVGGTSVAADCPLCGGPMRYESAGQAQQEVRELLTKRGKIEYRRAAARCPRCRKVFFPVGRTADVGDRRLQSGTAAED